MSTTVAYDYDADQPDAAEAADGVTAEWSGHTLTLSGLPAHQMVHVDADFAGGEGESATVVAAGRVADHALGAGGASTSTGTDGWIADGDGTLTVATGGEADLAALTVRLHASELTVQAVDDAVSAGETAEVVVTRSTPEVIDPADASEPMPAVSIALTTGGTATAGEDYEHVENELEMGEGDAEATLLINPRNPDGTEEEEGETIDLELNLDEEAEFETITLGQIGKPGSIVHQGNNPGISPAKPLPMPANPGTATYDFTEVRDPSGDPQPALPNDFTYTFISPAGVVTPGAFNVTPGPIGAGGRTPFKITIPGPGALAPAGVWTITITIPGAPPPTNTISIFVLV